GGAQIGVPLSTWDGAFTPVGGGVAWRNQIVEVGDPQPIGERVGRVPRRIMRPGDRILDPGEAVALAMEGARTEFAELPYLSRALGGAQPGEPRLVTRLDQRGTYNYLVPLELGGGADPEHPVLGAIAVDARFGDVTAVSAGEQPFQLWPISPEEA